MNLVVQGLLPFSLVVWLNTRTYQQIKHLNSLPLAVMPGPGLTAGLEAVSGKLKEVRVMVRRDHADSLTSPGPQHADQPGHRGGVPGVPQRALDPQHLGAAADRHQRGQSRVVLQFMLNCINHCTVWSVEYFTRLFRAEMMLKWKLR